MHVQKCPTEHIVKHAEECAIESVHCPDGGVHGAKMSIESGKKAIWIIKRGGRARPPACKSNKKLPGPSRCNVAMKAGYRNRGEELEPCYGASKSKPTLPNINPCDGSIDSLCLCVCGAMRRRETGKYSMCVADLICTETGAPGSGCCGLACTCMCSNFHT